jgi:hypothetical protein
VRHETEGTEAALALCTEDVPRRVGGGMARSIGV